MHIGNVQSLKSSQKKGLLSSILHILMGIDQSILALSVKIEINDESLGILSREMSLFSGDAPEMITFYA